MSEWDSILERHKAYEASLTPSNENEIDQPNANVSAPEEPKPPKRTLVGTAKDIGITALKGAIGVPESAVGLADLVSGGHAGKALENVGFKPKLAKQILDDNYSDAQKAANAKVENAKGFVDTAKAAIENPSTIATSIGESLPSMLAGGMVARGVGAAAKLGQKAAPYLAGLGEGVVSAGQGAEQIRQQTDDGLLTGKQAAIAAASGGLTGLIGAGSGKLAQKLGITDAQTLIAGGVQGTTNKGLARRVGEGALTEGALEELPQSVQEQMAQNVALGKNATEGVGNAAAMGLLTGGIMGGGMGVLHNPQQPPTQKPPSLNAAEQVAPVEPPAPTPSTPYPNNIQQDGVTRPVRPDFTMDLGGKEVVPYRQGGVATIPPAPEIKPNSPLNNALASAGISTKPQLAQPPRPIVSDAPVTNNTVNSETEINGMQTPPLLNSPLQRAKNTITPAQVESTIPQSPPRSMVYDPEQVKRDAETKAKLTEIANEPNRPAVRKLDDPRIETHADTLKSMMKDVQPNGGVVIMPDGSRTPSFNPDWYKGLRDALPTANLTPKAIEVAVNRAAEGKPLHKNQEAIVTAMLDHVDEQQGVEHGQPKIKTPETLDDAIAQASTLNSEEIPPRTQEDDLRDALARVKPYVNEDDFHDIATDESEPIDKRINFLNNLADIHEKKNDTRNEAPQPSSESSSTGRTSETPPQNGITTEKTGSAATNVKSTTAAISGNGNYDANKQISESDINENIKAEPYGANQNVDNNTDEESPVPSAAEEQRASTKQENINEHDIEAIHGTDKSEKSDSNETFKNTESDAGTGFTPTHELPSGEKVKLETDDEGNKYFVDESGDEWNYDQYAEPITNEKNTRLNEEPKNEDYQTSSTGDKSDTTKTILPKNPDAKIQEQTPTIISNSPTRKDESIADNSTSIKQEPILKVDGTPVASFIGARSALRKQGLIDSHEVVKRDDGSFVAVPKSEANVQAAKNGNLLLPQETSNNTSYDNVEGLVKRPSDNAPFSTEAIASKMLKGNKKLSSDEHDVVPVSGGFAIAPTKSLSFEQFKALPRNKDFGHDVLAQGFEAETGKVAPVYTNLNARSGLYSTEQSAKNAQSNSSNNSSGSENPNNLNNSEIPNSSQADFEKKAHEAATSPQNNLPEPTQMQKEAGNYKKGHVNFQGLELTIENPKGSKRSGTDKDGKEWSVDMAHHYGYVKGSVGADNEQVDVFVGDNYESTKAFVVNQIHPHNGKFDEHKVMLGFNTEAEAREGYLKNYAKGWKGLDSIAEIPVSELKAKIESGAIKKPIKSTPVEKSLENKQITTDVSKKSEKIDTLEQPKLKSDDLAKHLADAVRGNGIGYKQSKDTFNLTINGNHVATVDKQPTSAEGVTEQILRNYKAALDNEGKTLPSNPQDMTRDQFLIANKFGNVIKDFEISSSDLQNATGGLKHNSDGTFGIDHDALYDRIQAQKNEKSTYFEKIEDFGEKLGGAKKDIYKRMSDAVPDSEIINEPLSKSFPKPDISKIENDTVAAWVQSLRELIPTKPRKGYKLDRWVEQVKTLRKTVDDLLSGAINNEAVAEKINKDMAKEYAALRGLKAKVDLLIMLDRSLWDNVGKVEHYISGYGTTLYKDSKEMPAGTKLLELDGTRFYYKDNLSEVIDDIKKKLDVEPKESKMKFEVRGRAGAWGINKVGDKEYRKLKTFADSKEALTWAKENHDELVKLWESVKERDNITENDTRSKENKPRAGSDYRNGKDISAEEFTKTFGFRGVEFGNWVRQGSASQERQQMTNSAYDGLMDLANIIGIPPEAISLNGDLGLGFGSRGSGNAMAHFEPAALVINLTKTKGAGSLAHEWFHALDNYFQRQRNGNKLPDGAFITYAPENYYEHKTQRAIRLSEKEFNAAVNRENGSRYRVQNPADWNKVEGVRPEVAVKFANLVKALNESPMHDRAKLIDKNKSKGYWSSIIERAARSFESYIISEMRDKGYHNDYLANVTNADDFKNLERYPYLLDNEIAPIKAAFDDLFNTIETKKTDKGTALFSKTNSAANIYTKESLESALKNAADKEFGKGWFNRLLATGKFKMVESHQIKNLTQDRNVQAFYHNGTTYFVADGIAAKTDLVGLLKHEIGVHALKMGKYDAGFKGLLKQLEAMRGRNHAVDDAFKAAERAGTSAEDMAEEALGYLVEKHATQKITQRFLAWFRNVIRKLTGDRFANNLTVNDLNYMAREALRKAPDELIFDAVEPQGMMLSRVPDDAPVLKLTHKAIGTVQEIRNQAREYAKANFAGTKVHNDELNADITISMSGIKHTLSGKLGENLANSVFMIPEILKNGTYLGALPESKGNSSVLNHHYLAVKLDINGEIHDVVADIREMADGHFYYDHSFEKSNADAITPLSKLDKTSTGIASASKPEGFGENIPQSPNDSIKFSKTQPEGFEIPEETVIQKQQRLWQDSQNRWTTAQNVIKTNGGEIDDSNDVYRAMERMPHIAAERITDFKRDTLNPLIERVAKAKTNFDDVAKLLYAMHAPERNREMQKINPRFKNGSGSGMTDQEAKIEIQKLKVKYGADFSTIEEVAKDFQAITQDTAQMLEQSGAISSEEANAYQTAYKNYVPLKGFETLDEKGNRANGNGLGHSTAKKFGKRALGRESKAGQIIENIVRDHERAIVWQGKAEVGQVVEQLINDNPETIGTVDEIPVTAVMKGDKVTTMQTPFDPESEIRFLRDGKEVRIQLNDNLLLQSYNRLGESNLNGVFAASATLNRFLRQAWTQKNPAFFLINPIRDIQTAAVVLTGEGGAKLAAKAMKNWRSSWVTMLHHAMENESKLSVTERDILKRYRESGGSVGTAYISSLERAGEKLHLELARHGGETFQSLIKAGKIKEAAKTAAFRALNNRLFDFIENLNTAFEGATRLAAFKAAIDSGYSDMQAASLSSNVTVNFTKRGELGQQLGAMYLFANANIQGTANIFKTLTESNYKGQAWGIVGGIVALSFMATMMGGDDGEDDLVSDNEKQRNISIDIGDGKRINIPVAYGWSWFKDLGRAMAQMANGGDAEKISAKLASSFLGNFSPIGNPIPNGDFFGDNALVAFAPTATKPFVMPTVNKGAFGTPLMPESPFKPNQPDSEKIYRKTRGTGYEDIAKGLNSLTGGDSAKSGWIDISPETIKNTVNYIAGGAGRFLTDSAALAPTPFNDEAFKLENTPIAKSFYKSESIDDYRRRFYAQADDASKVAEQLAGYKKSGDKDRFRELYAEKGKLLALNKQATVTKKILQNLRDREDVARANGGSTAGIEAQERALLAKFNVMYTR